MQGDSCLMPTAVGFVSWLLVYEPVMHTKWHYSAKRATRCHIAQCFSVCCVLLRWLVVAEVLLHHPFYSDKVLAAVTLSAEEQEDMLARLGSRDLAAEVDESTIIHLLLRADSINRNRIDRSRLKVRPWQRRTKRGGLLVAGLR